MEKLIEKFQLNTKKGIENLVIFLVLVVIVMVVINTTFSKESVTVSENKDFIPVNDFVKEESFEKRLEKILSTIGGVSNVSVLISYENTTEKVPLFDTKETTTITEETDSNGGQRKTKQMNNEYSVAYEESGNNKTMIVKQNVLPKMIGVIITADGVSNSVIKEEIIHAVMAVTGLQSNKIQVFPK